MTTTENSATPTEIPITETRAVPTAEEHIPLGFKLRVLSRVARAAIGGLVGGPTRPHRSRKTEAFVRGAQAMMSAKGITVHRARGLQNGMAPMPRGFDFDKKEWTAALGDAPTSGDLPVVRFESPVHEKYASADAPRSWDLWGEWMAPKGFEAADPKNERVVLFFHGGAYILNDVAGYRAFLAPLVKEMGIRLFSVEYRLAPEHPFPAALDDAISAFFYLTQVEKIPAENVIVAGDSAGGNLANILTMFLRDHGHAMPAAQILISPWVDMLHDLPSEKEHAEYDILGGFSKSAEGGGDFNAVSMYLGAHRSHEEQVAIVKTERFVSPIADVGHASRALPPTFIATGGDEMLLDSNILFAANLSRIPGAPSVLVHDISLYNVHVFPFMTPDSADAARFRERAAYFANHVVTAPSAAGVQATIFEAGKIIARGAEEAWLARWDGIKAVKDLDWAPTAAALDSLIPDSAE
ncbi:hypothetical protein H9P43_004348 [Blastocladiella emersonii ATCC 22665]|nr:hypothetical protein H9P43_004348 [Blastocladiella emersonii ATCC 22665]